MDKALLVVSFGTSFKETREKTICALEHDLREAFPDAVIRRIGLSPIIGAHTGPGALTLDFIGK